MPRFNIVHKMNDRFGSSETSTDSSAPWDPMDKLVHRGDSYRESDSSDSSDGSSSDDESAGEQSEEEWPCRSDRQTKPPVRPGNVYGETKAPTQILRETAGTRK